MKHHKYSTTGRVASGLLAAAIAVSVATVASPAEARGVKPTGDASSLSVVLVDSTDSVANFGESVTFAVKTSEAKPMVSLDCYQSGEHVYWAFAGFYDGYPWPWNQTFVLKSAYWTGGAADCTATLYKVGKNGRNQTLATTSFTAAA